MSEERMEIQEPKNIETEQTSDYRSIFKATSLFGGIQVYNILISIIKSKFVALLLGPTGVGIQGLFQSSTQLIKSLSSFGLSQSAVRNVSEANSTGDIRKVSLVVTVLRRLVWVTGVLGSLLVIVLSPVLSLIGITFNLITQFRSYNIDYVTYIFLIAFFTDFLLFH